MRLPDDIRTLLRTAEPTRPRLTWYGEGAGERVELSGRVLDNWAAKAGNLLQEELDAGPGTVLQIDLPAGHWRSMYWALAAWSIGATVDMPGPHHATDIDVLVTSGTAYTVASSGRRPAVIAVNLETLARRASRPLEPGDIDEARELSTYGDVLDCWQRPELGAMALRSPAGNWTFDELVADAGHRPRVLAPAVGPAGVLARAALSVWAADGSVVIAPAGGALTSSGPDSQGTSRADELDRLTRIEGAQLLDPARFAQR